MTVARKKRSNAKESLIGFLSGRDIENRALKNEKVNNSIDDVAQTFEKSNGEDSISGQAKSYEIDKTEFHRALRKIVLEELPKVAKDLRPVKIPSKKGNERNLYLRKTFFEKFQKTPNEAPEITRNRIAGAAQLYLEQVRSLDALDDRINNLQNFNNSYRGLRNERKTKESSEN